MNRPFIPVSKPQIGLAERRAVDRVLKSGFLAQGPEVEAFEAEFSNVAVDGRPCVAVNSGTSALHLGLLAAGIGPGDEVIVPSFTFAATANAVAMTGATPVFVDISLDDFCIDPQAVEAAVSPKTAAVMPVHLYGHPASMHRIMEIAARHKLAVLEDAAQAHLATLKGQKVGTFGMFAAFSLYPTKNMTSGEGGMVSVQDEDLARKIRLLRNQGMEKQYENEVVGLNNRMTDVHAAIGRVQLKKLEKWTAKRRLHAKYLMGSLKGVITPTPGPDVEHSFHQFTVRVTRQRDRVAINLRERFGVGTGVYYPIPSHLLPALRGFPTVGPMTQTSTAAETVLSLPVHPGLRPTELARIARALNTLAGSIQ